VKDSNFGYIKEEMIFLNLPIKWLKFFLVTADKLSLWATILFGRGLKLLELSWEFSRQDSADT
jgi:hypothetical protein